jgi:hypothetical protein
VQAVDSSERAVGAVHLDKAVRDFEVAVEAVHGLVRAVVAVGLGG